ncbi:MAG: hypothetical protein HKL90_08010, partial [Elusimicrobia bacterium]|nr:hypothetical protein [Elusimicrobiota bacterium]
ASLRAAPGRVAPECWRNWPLCFGMGGRFARNTQRVLAGYKSLLEIKKLRAGLEEQKIPKSTLAEIDKHANSVMEETIRGIADEIMSEHGKTIADDGRRHELKAGIIFALREIANRIDRGFSIEIRALPQPNTNSGDTKPEDVEENRRIDKIRVISNNLKYPEPGAASLLSLEERPAQKDSKK